MASGAVLAEEFSREQIAKLQQLKLAAASDANGVRALVQQAGSDAAKNFDAKAEAYPEVEAAKAAWEKYYSYLGTEAVEHGLMSEEAPACCNTDEGPGAATFRWGWIPAFVINAAKWALKRAIEAAVDALVAVIVQEAAGPVYDALCAVRDALTRLVELLFDGTASALRNALDVAISALDVAIPLVAPPLSTLLETVRVAAKALRSLL